MLPITIDELKSTIARREGVARSNRFAVYINLPLIDLSLSNIVTNLLQGNPILNGTLNNPKDISMLCESIIMPGVDITTFDSAYGNKRTKFPHAYDQADCQMTFLLTNDMFIKRFFDKWSEKVINKQTGILGYKKSYQTDIVIQQLDVKNFPIHGIKLYNAYPVSIQDIQLSNNGDNEITRLTVNVTYDRAIPADSLASSVGALGVIGGSLTNFQIGF